MPVMLGEGFDQSLRHAETRFRVGILALVRSPMTLSSQRFDVLRPGSFKSTADLVDLIPAEKP